MSQRVLTGVKPTSVPHLGNYIGAMRPSIELSQSVQESFLFIADYHAITSIQDPKLLEQYNYEVTACWMACGLDPKKTVIYRQSDVPEIFELNWIIGCVTPKGLMNRGHAYKAMLQQNEEAGRKDPDDGVSVGLYTYPVLMSADILLFSSDLVPVGEDQLQHIEYARDIAEKFNRVYGEVLNLPKPHIQKGTLVPGLDGRKMSKSYNNHIPLFLESKKLRKLIMKIKTDSTPPEDPKELDSNDLYTLYKHFATSDELSLLEARYKEGVGWGEVKQTLFEKIEDHFKEPTRIYNDLMNDKSQLDQILKEGSMKAREIAAPLMSKVRAAIRGN